MLFLFLATCALAGCGLSDQQKSDYAAVQRAGVSPAIYDKMINGEQLGIGDIIALSQARVSDGVIVRYIRDQDSTYYLNQYDIEQLHKSGVSPSVIDYMAQTGRPEWPYYGPGPGPYYPYPPIAVGLGFGFGGRWR